jgi:hypothetical protein
VKRKSYRNQAMRDSANGEACVNCGLQDGTVVLAHLPMMGIADGGSSKCDDYVSAYLCRECHEHTDGKYRRDVFWRYRVNMETIRRMFDKGVIKA